MVGIFSRISGHKGSAQQRPHLYGEGDESAVPAGETMFLVPTVSGAYAIEVATEFKPIDHPVEPQDNDQPVKCPIPESSILNDGRLWKLRFAEGKKGNVARTSQHPAQLSTTGIKPCGEIHPSYLPSWPQSITSQCSRNPRI